jgi:DNA-binding PadR family transcriptional regulator
LSVECGAGSAKGETQFPVSACFVRKAGYGLESKVEEGSLYPALYRLELDGAGSATWGVSENNRKAKYYEITRVGES